MQTQLDSANNMGWVLSLSPGERHEHVYVATPLSVFKKRKRKKWYFRQKKRMELAPQTHIYLESVSPGERHKHIYKATPISVFKKQKMVLLQEKKGATHLNFGMQAQLDSANNMGSRSHMATPFLFVCKAKNVKNGTSKTTLI